MISMFFDRHGAGDGVVAVGVEVLEDADGFHYGVGAADGAEGHVAARDPLGHGDEIGLDVEVLEAEPFARPAEAADHLVDDEEDAVAGADLADDAPVLLGGGVGSEGLLDGLADHGRDLFGVLELDDPLDVAGAGEVAGRVGEVERAAVAVGRLDEDRSGRQGLHHLPHGKDGAEEAEGAARGPVIGAPAGDDLVPFLLPSEVLMVLGQFDGRFHGFGSVADIEEMADLSGGYSAIRSASRIAGRVVNCMGVK